MASAQFIGPLDLRAYTPNEWVVLTPLQYRMFKVRRGFITDLASIPRILKSLISVNDDSRKPAVLHDYLYTTQPVSRAEADFLFLEALESVGVGYMRRHTLYTGVRIGGWIAWNGHKNDKPEDNFVPDSYWEQ